MPQPELNQDALFEADNAFLASRQSGATDAESVAAAIATYLGKVLQRAGALYLIGDDPVWQWTPAPDGPKYGPGSIRATQVHDVRACFWLRGANDAADDDYEARLRASIARPIDKLTR